MCLSVCLSPSSPSPLQEIVWFQPNLRGKWKSQRKIYLPRSLCVEWREGDNVLVCWRRQEQLLGLSLVQIRESTQAKSNGKATVFPVCLFLCCLWFVALQHFRCCRREWKAKAHLSIDQTHPPTPPCNSIQSHQFPIQEELGIGTFVQMSILAFIKWKEIVVRWRQVTLEKCSRTSAKKLLWKHTCCWEVEGTPALHV